MKNFKNDHHNVTSLCLQAPKQALMQDQRLQQVLLALSFIKWLFRCNRLDLQTLGSQSDYVEKCSQTLG